MCSKANHLANHTRAIRTHEAEVKVSLRKPCLVALYDSPKNVVKENKITVCLSLEVQGRTKGIAMIA